MLLMNAADVSTSKQQAKKTGSVDHKKQVGILVTDSMSDVIQL